MVKLLQALLRWCFMRAENLFNLAFGDKLNPFYHLGTISFWQFWLLVGTGFYLYIFADTGVHNAFESVEAIFPEAAQPRMKMIVKRESGGNPLAKNKSSSASGCTQMLKIHAARFAKLGYSWDQRFVAYINVRVAYDLWEEQGWSPWSLTAY